MQEDKFGYYSNTNPFGAAITGFKSIFETAAIVFSIIILILRMYTNIEVAEFLVILQQTVVYLIFIFEFTMAIVGNVKCIANPETRALSIFCCVVWGIIVVTGIVFCFLKQTMLPALNSNMISTSEYITLIMLAYLIASPIILYPIDAVTTIKYWDEIEI